MLNKLKKLSKPIKRRSKIVTLWVNCCHPKSVTLASTKAPIKRICLNNFSSRKLLSWPKLFLERFSWGRLIKDWSKLSLLKLRLIKLQKIKLAMLTTVIKDLLRQEDLEDQIFLVGWRSPLYLHHLYAIKCLP